MFAFDPDKSASNRVKHGIDFVEAQALWKDEKRFETPTRDGAFEELRWAVVGEVEDRLWTAIITYRGEDIRLISVRRARDNEQGWYHGGRV